MVEIKDPQFKPELYRTGVETPIFVEDLPAGEERRNTETQPSPDLKEEELRRTLNDAVRDGKVGYDSPEVKEKVISNISPSQAESWDSALKSKVQGAEISSL